MLCLDDEEERLEREHWESVMQTFLSYSNFVSLELMRRQTHINRLAAAVANRLPSITFDKFAAIEDAAKRNQDFCKFLIFRFGVDSSHSIQFNSIQYK